MLVAEEWIEMVLDVKGWSARIIVLRVVVGRSVVNLVSVYAPQSGREKEEKEEFFTVLGKILSDIDVGERLLICGDMNGHVGAEVDSFEGVHGGYGFGRRNVDGEMLLEFSDALDLDIVNTWFKQEVRKMITYETKACKTVIDFSLIRKRERKLVRDVKVIHEEGIKQHKLLICVLDLKEKLVRSKVKFMKRCKVWKLKEAVTEGIFRQRVQARVAMSVGKPKDAEGVWKDLKECMLSNAVGVCRETKGVTRHKETWWWNDEVAALVQEKKRLFRLWKG